MIKFFWPLTRPAPPVIDAGAALLNPLDRTLRATLGPNLGAGLLRPFMRDQKNDFAHDAGVANVKACVGQVLGTLCASDFTQGEVPWRTEFGSTLYLLRQQNNNAALQALGRHYVIDALARWEPRVKVRSVKFVLPQPNVLDMTILYDIVSTNSPGNSVLVPGVQQTVTA